MIESLALDALLLLILFLLTAIGLYRGGVREVCTSAGALLGILVAQQWSSRWGTWLADRTGIDEGVSQFVMAVSVLVVVTGVLGYGAATAFSYSPGPGGRVFGGLIAAGTGVVLLGAVVQFVALYLYDGVYPDLIRRGYISRVLSTGFDWVLLVVAVVVVMGTVFGAIVRERETDDLVIDTARDVVPVVRRTTPSPSMAPEPIKMAPAETHDPEPITKTAAVKIREIRHWEEQNPPTMKDLQSGWSRTWPSHLTSDSTVKPGRPFRTGMTGKPAPRPTTPVSQDEEVIREWLAEDQSTRRTYPVPPRPVEDE